LQLPEDGYSLQPKHAGALKPTAQLVRDKIAWILACILLSLWSRATIFFHGVPVPHSMSTTNITKISGYIMKFETILHTNKNELQ